MPRKRLSLERQITIALIFYSVLLSAAVFTHGLMVNERAERMVWEAMLDVEMENRVDRRTSEPNVPWKNSGKLNFYDMSDRDRETPSAISHLAPGLHDNVFFDANEWVVLVRDQDGTRYLLALDIDGFEDLEWQLVKPVIASSVMMVLALAIVTFLGAKLLADPLRKMARNISGLRPEDRGQKVEVSRRGSAELQVIANALNDYLCRSDQFVERERSFINTASHELRTPLAVIKGAAEIAASDRGLSASAALQIKRISTTTRDVEQLVSLLLILAKDPGRMQAISERFHLEQLLPSVVADHRYLCAEKDLALEIGPLPACLMVGPEAVVRASIGNLVRNAIENSDRGIVTISLDAMGIVRIEDPGHGMSPEEISAIYARAAREGGARGSGIGLALISRLCMHLGWNLTFEPVAPQGTVAVLDLRVMRVAD